MEFIFGFVAENSFNSEGFFGLGPPLAMTRPGDTYARTNAYGEKSSVNDIEGRMYKCVTQLACFWFTQDTESRSKSSEAKMSSPVIRSASQIEKQNCGAVRHVGENHSKTFTIWINIE